MLIGSCDAEELLYALNVLADVSALAVLLEASPLLAARPATRTALRAVLETSAMMMRCVMEGSRTVLVFGAESYVTSVMAHSWLHSAQSVL